MSRKKAARAKKNNIKKQVENAAEVTETAKAQETAGQAATGEIPSPDVQTEAETAESETEVKEAAETVEEAEPKEAEKIEEKAEPEEAEKIEEKAEPEEAEKIEEK
ncbi:MAG: amylosucrase, partial [Ruminococcus sp.]|nr:amylosucrase [Ruminococcus sp.]